MGVQRIRLPAGLDGTDKEEDDGAALRLAGVAAHRERRYEAAIDAFRRLVERPVPSNGQRAGDLANLGAALRAGGKDEDAEAAYRAAIALDPGCAAAHHNLGNLLAATGRVEAAEAAQRAALSCLPGYAQAWNALGGQLQRRGALREAADAFAASVRHAPGWVEAKVNLGVALLNCDLGQEAMEVLRDAIGLAPVNAAAHGNLGAVYLRAGLPLRAETCLRQAVALDPRETRWRSNLAVALQMQGRHAETEQCCREVLAMRPGYAAAHGNLLFAMNYRDDLTPQQIFAEYAEWNARHAAPLAPAAPRFANDRTPGRRLRVGYVSPDFRHHAVAFFSEPLLAAHDRVAIELFCYSELGNEDAATTRFRALADHWRPTLGMSDAAMVELIQADGIDVLVDLAGHTSANRLLVFARRAAPVQVASLLGHGYTSGLAAMDGILVDDVTVPLGTEGLFSETMVRIGRLPFVYRPPEGMPEVAPAPVLRKGYVTFGHFGRPERLNEAVIATWARILLAVPGARLMLNTRAMQEAEFRTLIAARFAARGIPAERLDLVFTHPQTRTWEAYGDVDIALDPFPHNAGTTTVEALWLGVPVVTLASRPSVGTLGAGILTAAGLADWVAADVDDYVARAVAAASNSEALARLRQELRPRLRASPLCDAAGLARRTEQAYRALWERWAGGDAARLRGYYGEGQSEAAARLARRMIARDSDAATAEHVLALLAHADGRAEDAAAAIGRAIALSPGDAEMRANQAAILRVRGDLGAAEAAARAALAMQPGSIQAMNNLGNILRDAGRWAESAAAYRQALAIAPDFADAWANLAWVLSLAGEAHAAEEAARRSLVADPKNANAANNLGLALMRQGRLVEAEATLRGALALRPDFAQAHSNVLFCLNYRDDLTAPEIAAEYRRWDRAHAAPLGAVPCHRVTDRDPERRLRVGYVSPDFRHHAVAFFAEPLLRAHDRGAVEVTCYAEVPVPDATTARFQALADRWVSTVGMRDADVAARIAADGIDVLVDLAGHTAGNRLLAFARRPAPVMLASMLGSGTTSGLSAMAGFIADAELAPPGSEALFSEKVLRLGRVPLAYAPPAGMPEAGPLPALREGRVTFGYFGRTVRLNDRVLRTWARLLSAVPGARLVLNSAPFAEAAGRAQMMERFVACGLPSERLELIFTSPQPRTWEAYGGIDIALDPFPHNAGTTTMEALWLGVPVLTLADRPGVGRIGASLLCAAGLDDFVARDEDDYIARACSAARDLTRLAALRATLRARIAASPLCDAAGLGRAMEDVYRAAWRDWCAGGG